MNKLEGHFVASKINWTADRSYSYSNLKIQNSLRSWKISNLPYGNDCIWYARRKRISPQVLRRALSTRCTPCRSLYLLLLKLRKIRLGGMKMWSFAFLLMKNTVFNIKSNRSRNIFNRAALHMIKYEKCSYRSSPITALCKSSYITGIRFLDNPFLLPTITLYID
jgi:hypothetical protein